MFKLEQDPEDDTMRNSTAQLNNVTFIHILYPNLIETGHGDKTRYLHTICIGKICAIMRFSDVLKFLVKFLNEDYNLGLQTRC